ncbi:MAG: PEP-utilizing enzyme [Clostridia bacterium]|nr:PEP-utilizing enzyme [Clostridia bacterium]
MIRKLEEIAVNDIENFGTKAVNLGLLMQKDFNVPKGYAISKSFTNKIRNNGFQLAEEDLTLLQELYNQMGHTPIAVRSSAISEDTEGTSFAGQYDTVLSINDYEAYLKAIEVCIKSSDSENVTDYADKMQVANQHEIALIVQTMITGETSGVMFTADPITGNRKKTIVNAAKGLGKGVVDGTSKLDRYVITDQIELTDKSGMESIMRDDMLFALKNLGDQIESYFKRPQDIEWTIRDSEIFILQSRDITTLYPIDEDCLTDDKLHLYLCYNTVVQGMKEPFTPLGYDFWRATIAGYTSIFYNFKRKIRKPAWVKSINGRMYYDLTEVLGRKLIGKNILNTFNAKDPEGGKLLRQLYSKYSNIFIRQGGSFRLSFGLIKWGMSLGSVGKISKKDIDKALAEALALGNDYIDNLKVRIAAARTYQDKVDLMEDVTEELVSLGFKQAMYLAYGSKAIEQQIKWLSERYPDLDYSILKKAVYNNPTTEMGIALLEIASDVATGKIDQLETSDQLADFLEKYGHRSVLDIDMGIKRWYEDPTYILELIKLYSEERPAEKLEAIYGYRRDAKKLIDTIYNKVANDHGVKKAEKIVFDLKNFRTLSGLREQPKFISVKAFALLRAMFIEVGKDLVAKGHLHTPEDIAFLYGDDILAYNKLDLIALVEERKETYKRQLSYTVIPRIILSNGETYVYPTLDQQDSDGLKGVPISAGKVTGTVRIMDKPNTQLLQDGDIIVTHNTDPSWTPLFPMAKGLIMESGGPISHGAIVAREFGLPGIAGVTNALKVLKDGDVVCMDGATGVVEIISRKSE